MNEHTSSGSSTLPGDGVTGPGVSEPTDEAFWKMRGWWGRAGQTAVGVWAAAAVSFLGTVIAARALGPGEYGSVVLAISVVTLVATFLDVTLEEATVFYGNRALAAGDLAGLRALLKRSLKVDIGTGILVTGALVALAAPMADAASADPLDPTLVRLAALSILVVTANGATSATLLLARRTHLRAWSMAAASVFRLLGVVVAVQFGGAEAVVLSYALGGAAGSLVLGLLAWRVGWRKWDPGPRSSAPPVGIWELFRFGLHSSATTSLAAVYGSLVPLLLGTTAGHAAVGIFQVAMLPVVAANLLNAPIRLALFPEQARLFAAGHVEELRRSVKGYTLIGFALGSLGAVVAWFALPVIIPLFYSSSFDAAVLPARILLVTAVFWFALSWGKTLAAAVGRPQIRTVLAAVELAVVASLIVVLGDLGSKGAAIAVSSGSVAVGIAWLIFARRLFNEESLVESNRAAS